MRNRLLLSAAITLICSITSFGIGAQLQSHNDTKHKLDTTQRALEQVIDERRNIEKKRKNASKQLRVADKQLSESSRVLHNTEIALTNERNKFATLVIQRDVMKASLHNQRSELATQLRATYTIGNHASLKLLLTQDRVADANRLLAWYRYLQNHRAQRIAELTKKLTALDTLRKKIKQQQQTLEVLRKRQNTQMVQLQRKRKSRTQAAAELEKLYLNKRSREHTLEQNVRTLKKLLARLNDATNKKRSAEQVNRDVNTPVVLPLIKAGTLSWPLSSGTLLAKYGSNLPDGGTSTGLLIGAAAGTTVKAVANGKVVFSDWLNGYGLILIIDHGNGYMSLYARNETLLRNIDEGVTRDTPVSSVGRSRSTSTPALYFELRHDGEPINPEKWLRKTKG